MLHYFSVRNMIAVEGLAPCPNQHSIPYLRLISLYPPPFLKSAMERSEFTKMVRNLDRMQCQPTAKHSMEKKRIEREKEEKKKETSSRSHRENPCKWVSLRALERNNRLMCIIR